MDTIEQKIMDRQTEIQTSYDLAIYEKNKLEYKIDFLSKELNVLLTHIELIKQRAREQNIEHIL